MIQVKHKVEIMIIMDEMNRIAVSTSSKNLVTNLGMLELAKRIVQGICKDDSEIIVPQMVP